MIRSHITPYVPSRIRTRPYNLIRALARLGHRVTLLTAAGHLVRGARTGRRTKGLGSAGGGLPGPPGALPGQLPVGTPVVSSPAGCAALAAEAGREVLIAEGEEELAAAVLQVLSDPTPAERLAAVRGGPPQLAGRGPATGGGLRTGAF